MNAQDPNVTPPGGSPPAEDAGSQALSEALHSSFVIVQIIMVALVLVFLGSGFFTVGPQEQAIILRMGKPVDGGRLFPPGPHWAWPAPIDEVVRLRITSVTSADSTIGYFLSPEDRARNAPEPSGAARLNPATWTYGLTKDTNIIHVAATAHYRITDPTAFHFNFVNAATFITNALNNALLVACSEFSVDDILTFNQKGFDNWVDQQVKKTVEAEKLGVTVDQVAVTHRSPPLYLKPRFYEFNQATLNREKMLNTAQSYATSTTSRAQGEADTIVKVADAVRKWRVDTIAAQADKFKKELAQYEQDPELFKRIRQMLVLEDVYTNAMEMMLVPPNTKELRLQINREPQEPSVANIPTQP